MFHTTSCDGPALPEPAGVMPLARVNPILPTRSLMSLPPPCLNIWPTLQHRPESQHFSARFGRRYFSSRRWTNWSEGRPANVLNGRPVLGFLQASCAETLLTH